MGEVKPPPRKPVAAPPTSRWGGEAVTKAEAAVLRAAKAWANIPRDYPCTDDDDYEQRDKALRRIDRLARAVERLKAAEKEPVRVGSPGDTGCYSRQGKRCEGYAGYGCRHCGRIIGSKAESVEAKRGKR